MKIAGMPADERRFRTAVSELDYVRAFLDGARLGAGGNSTTTLDKCWEIVNNAQHCLNTAITMAQKMQPDDPID